MERVLPACAALLVLLACTPPRTPEELLRDIEANPTDVETAAQLALTGKPMAKGLIELMEKCQGTDARSERIRQSATAILFVSGDACSLPCIDYIELGANNAVKERILLVMGKGRWHASVYKLINRLDHSQVGSKIHECLTQIFAGEEVPPDPWAVEDPERTQRYAQWNNFKGKKAGQFAMPNFRETNYTKDQLPQIRLAIQAELNNPAWK